MVFTAGTKEYADWILDEVDHCFGYVSHRLYRDHTVSRNGIYIKDLSKLGRDLNKTLIIDNIEENFQLQPDNGIRIESWYDDPKDKELEYLLPLLKGIVVTQLQDVRHLVRLYTQKQKRKQGCGTDK